MDVDYSTGQFVTALLRVPHRDTRPLTEIIQQVQRSAFPDAYAKWEGTARALLAAMSPTWGPWMDVPLGSRDLARWDRGSDVVVWQTLLATNPDGRFGLQTQAATQGYQILIGATSTGIVDQGTVAPFLAAKALP